MSAPHADDRTPARPDGRRNGHPTTLLSGAGPDGGGPDGAGPDGEAPPADTGRDTATPAPGPVPAPRVADEARAEEARADARADDTVADGAGPAASPPVPAPEPAELTGPVDVRNRPGPRTPPMPWPAVPAEGPRPPGGVPAQRTGPGDAGRPGRPEPGQRPGHHPGPQAGPVPPRHPGPHPQHTPPTPWAPGPPPGHRAAGGPLPAAPGRAPWGAPWAAPTTGVPAPVPVVYPPGHASSGSPAGRWDALRARLSAVRIPDGGVRGAVPHRAAAVAVAVTLVLAAAVVTAAYLGSDRPGDTAASPGTGPAPVAAPTDLVAGTTAADPAGFGSPVSFTSPTGNISCRITGGAGDGAVVRCDVTARNWSAGDCPDSALVAGGPAGARTECGGAPVVASGASVLGYGTHLTEGDVTCVSSRTGVECRDARTGAGFAAARAAYRLY